MNKNRPAMLLVAWLCLPTLLVAQVTSKENDLSLKRTDVKPEFVKGAAPDYSKEPYVFELIQTKVRFEADGKGQREVTIRARVQSESAVRELGLLAYPFASSFESLEVVYVRVRKPDGSVVETPQSDVQELDSAVSREAPMYSDTREKHIAVKSLTVGDVLEAQLRWTMHDAVAPGHFWFVDSFFHDGICLKETMQLDLPKAAGVRVETDGVKPSIEEKGDRKVYTLETTNLKKDEKSKIPDWEKNFYGIDPPEVRVSSFHSWEEVGTWFAQLQQPKTVVTPEIQSKAEELTKGKATEEEKIRALYDFVSTHFRYIGVDLGVGRYQPHAAADILANRYGDCKDKHTLFAALLSSVGLKAYPALISSRYRVDPGFPAPDLFDHVITAVPQGDSYQFLDTTPEVAPYGLLLANLRDRQALVMPGNAPARLAKTPAEPPFPSFEKVTIDSSIDTEGTLDAKMRIESRGDAEIGLRAAYRATPQNRWEELTQVFVHQMGFAGKSSEVTVGRPEDTSQPFVVSLTYHRTEFPDWKNHQISLPAPLLSLTTLTDEQKTSRKPLPLGRQDITYESTVKLPKDYSALLPDNVTKKTEFAEFTAEYKMQSQSVLHGSIHWKTLEREAPGDKRNEYVELAKTVEDVGRRFIPITGEFPLNQANLAAVAAILAEHPDAVPELEKAVEAQPGNQAIAIMLANAYKKANRTKDAVSLLEKRLAASPEDAWLNVAAGEANLALGESKKAMEFFRKGLRNDPQPVLLNNVAYALADAKSNLDEAESYAKQAVTQLSLQTKEISAEDADTDDFGLMVILAKTWDTLGWAEFQKGDFERAEKYLAAAWELSQDPVAGEHLVEVLEKQGRTARAARVCMMALSTYGDDSVRVKLTHAMDRLQKYLPQRRTDGAVELSYMRTLPIAYRPKLVGKSATAQVVVAFEGGDKGAEVRFVSGDETLRKGIEALAKAKYPQTFPDDLRVRVIRKGTFNCSFYTKECLLLLMPTIDAAVPGG
jgi:tetratricopeptide (TPR) repeat protein